MQTTELSRSDNAVFPIFDGHNDVLLRLYKAGREQERLFFEQNSTGHIDLPRARQGNFGGGFFAIYVPAGAADLPSIGGAALPPAADSDLPSALELAYSQKYTFAMAAILLRLQEQSAGRLKLVHTAAELSECLQSGVLAVVMHIEGAEGIDPDMDALEVLYAAGLRSLGIVWSRPNRFAEGVPFRCPSSPDTGPGLTDLGRKLVQACNRLGVMLDLSHMNEKGFWDIAALSDAPLVATHSNVHAICPSTRNLTDRQLDAIKESDGMVGVNFGIGFLEATRDPSTSIADIVKHLDYLVERIGIDRVGFGSDFDGTTVPQDLGDVAGMPKLMDALRARGYDDVSLRKLAHENWVRVLRKTWGE